MTGIDGVTFEECYQGKSNMAIGDRQVPFIGFDQLLKNKAASARAKDKIDLEELKRIRRERQQ